MHFWNGEKTTRIQYQYQILHDSQLNISSDKMNVKNVQISIELTATLQPRLFMHISKQITEQVLLV